MNDILEVSRLETMKKLIDEHQLDLKKELAITKIEEILQASFQKIEHHNIVFAFEQLSMNVQNVDTASKRSIEFGFSFQEGWNFIDVDVALLASFVQPLSEHS